MTAGVNTSFVNVIVDVMGSLAERLSAVSKALMRQLPHLRSDDIGSRCRREWHAQGGCTEGLLKIESAMVATFLLRSTHHGGVVWFVVPQLTERFIAIAYSAIFQGSSINRAQEG